MFNMTNARNRNPWVLSALGAILIALTMPSTSSAAIIITVTQIGSDLKVDYSGGFTGIVSVDRQNPEPTFFGVDTNSMFALAVESPQDYAQINGTLASNGGTNPRSDFFPLITPNSFPLADSVDGGSETLIIQNDRFGAVPSFTGGSYSATGSMTFNNTSFADWGLTAGQTAVWNWTESGESFVAGNTVTITAVPEPATAVLLPLGAAAMLNRRRRK